MADPLVGARKTTVVQRNAIFEAAKQAAEVARVDLPKSLTDAIAAQDVDVFVQNLALLKPSTRADDASYLRLLEAGLNALGTNTKVLGAAVNTLFARASGSSVRLATTADSRQSPLLKAMDDGMLLTGVLRHELARYHLEQDSLLNALKTASTSADPALAIRDVESKVDLGHAPDYVAGALVDAYLASGALNDAARVFEGAHPEFQALASTRETYAKVLLLAHPASAGAHASKSLAKHGGVDGLGADLRGAYRLDTALANTGPARAQLLAQAAKELTAAVKESPLGVWPAVDLMRAQLARGDTAGAHVTAQLVAENALHLHGWQQADAADLKAGAAALTVLGRTAEAHALTLAAASAPEGDLWSEARSQRAFDASRGTSPPTTIGPEKSPSPSAASAGDAVVAKTYGYAATKSRVYAGNYRFGGIAHDERFSPENARFFARLLDANGIMQRTDPADVNKKIDELIRAHNHTGEMEDMGSATHKTFDDTVVGLKDVMPGSKVNCSTDVAADWLLQLSDCRQHAAIKCAMFETWKAGQRSAHWNNFLNASERRDPGGASAALEKVKALDAMTMRVLEIVVVQSSDNKPLEEHTANVLLQRATSGSNAGKIQATLADSFYQNLYNLGGGAVALTPTAEGGVRFASPTLKRSDGAPIHLDTTSYAGDRSRPASTLDQLNFRGRQLAGEDWSSTTSLQGVDFGALTWLANPQKLTENMVSLGTSMLAAKTLGDQVETLVKHCPEMLWLTGDSRATPEAFAANVKEAGHADVAATVDLWLKGPQFANNAMGSVLLCALVNGDYDGFTHCQKDAVRLTRASFDALAADVKKSLTRIGADAAPELHEKDALALGLATLTYYGTFKDLPKLEATKKILEDSLGGDVAASPEALLHKVLGRQLKFLTDPSSFNADSQALAMKALIAAPTFETLALGTRKAMVGAFGADFNLGQMLQLLEFPAVKLAELAKLPSTERELVDVEGLMDIAGVKGSVVRDGSATITEDYYRRYTAARDATQAAVGGASAVDAFNGLFDTLTKGLGLDPKVPTDLVIGKIAVALQATTPAFCAALRTALEQLPAADPAFLIGELAENGLTRRAIIPRNLPALMRNLERDAPSTTPPGSPEAQAGAAVQALKAVLPLLREVRAHLDAHPDARPDEHGGTYQIDLLSLAGVAATEPQRVRAGVKTTWAYGADGATLHVA